jgi:hypothetical protein
MIPAAVAGALAAAVTQACVLGARTFRPLDMTAPLIDEGALRKVHEARTARNPAEKWLSGQV